MTPRRRRGARPAIAFLLASLALAASASDAGTPAAGMPAAGTPAAGMPAAGTPVAGMPAAGSAPDGGDLRQALRLVEYEALLGAPLEPDQALCIDALLERRWPRAETPSRPQWERMQEQARQAREQCASPAGDAPDRAAGVIRRAMALQVERQRALAALQARLRACLATAPDSAECQALRRLEALTPAQRERAQAAYEQGRR